MLDAGREIEPSTSAPSDARHRLAGTATAEPALEPSGLRSSTCGWRVWSPRLLHPDTARVLRIAPVARLAAIKARLMYA